MIRLVHQKSGTTHALTGLTGVTGTVSCVFTATAAFAAGDTFTVDGELYTVQLSNGEAAEDSLFVSGAAVPVIVDTGAKKVNFKSAGSSVKLPAETTALLKIFTSNSTFTAPQKGKYRITVIGGGGNGCNDYVSDAGGGGGGSGGVAQSVLSLDTTTSYQITVSSAQTSFGNLLTGVKGNNSNSKSGGSGGTASGGEFNFKGQTGKSGRHSDTSNYDYGGDGAGYSSTAIAQIPFLSSKGGDGGVFRVGGEGNQDIGLSPTAPSKMGFFPYGCGSGGMGSIYADNRPNYGATGAVIIEFVLE